MGSQPLPRHPLASLQVFFTGCRWISESPWSFMGCRGTAASPWSVPWAAGESQLWSLEHLCPSFSTGLGICRVVLLTSLTSSNSFLYWLQLPLCNNFFFPFINITKVLTPFLIGPSLSSSIFILQPLGSGSDGHGNCCHLLTEVTPISPPTTKTWSCKPCKNNTESSPDVCKFGIWE